MKKEKNKFNYEVIDITKKFENLVIISSSLKKIYSIFFFWFLYFKSFVSFKFLYFFQFFLKKKRGKRREKKRETKKEKNISLEKKSLISPSMFKQLFSLKIKKNLKFSSNLKKKKQKNFKILKKKFLKKKRNITKNQNKKLQYKISLKQFLHFIFFSFFNFFNYHQYFYLIKSRRQIFNLYFRKFLSQKFFNSYLKEINYLTFMLSFRFFLRDFFFLVFYLII